ncbi:hypothetical protein U2F10_02690 [Leptothoe sp. EHU-05/26/07-4]
MASPSSSSSPSYVQIQTSYLVLGSELWEKFQTALGMRGGAMTGFVNAIVADFFQQNLDYYLAAGKLDAEARGYNGVQGAYYRALLEDDLKPWQEKGLRPDFPTSPLKRIADAGEARKNQHRLKQIRVSEYHAGLLRLAMEVDDLTLIQVTSRIVIWHLLEYWDVKGGYQWQISGGVQETLEPEI